jgi:uncharacterized protein (DUF4415 family)
MSKQHDDRRAAAHRRAKRALAGMSDEEDAAIRVGALADPDNPPLTGEQLAKFQPTADVRPDLIRRLRGQRGTQKSKPLKERVSLRLDPEVVDHFRRRGPGWQSRINATLRKVLKLRKMPAAAKR